MNIANKLTVLRIMLVPVFLVTLSLATLFWYISALAIFLFACLTDLYDGWLARHYGQISEWGKFVDPLADKILCCSAFVCFVGMPQLNIPAWMVALIIMREFIISGLRTMSALKGPVIAASEGGKIKAVIQMIVVIAILLIIIIEKIIENFSLVKIFSDPLGDFYLSERICSYIFQYSPMILTLIATIVTTISGLNYLIKHKELVSVS